MTANTYPKRRLPLFGNGVPRNAKRLRNDVSTPSGEPLSLRGGSGPSTQGEGSPDDDTPLALAENTEFILALCKAAGIGFTEGVSPPQDREILRHGIKAWKLFQDAIDEDFLDRYVTPALLEVNDQKAVGNMNALLKQIAEAGIKGNRKIPRRDDFKSDYANYTRRVDCADLAYYLTSIICWLVNDRPLYERLGFEIVHWKAKIYRDIWRLNTAKCLYTRGNRPQLERESLYGNAAQEQIKNGMEKDNAHLERIKNVRKQLKRVDPVEATSPTSPTSSSSTETFYSATSQPNNFLLPGQRAKPSSRRGKDSSQGVGDDGLDEEGQTDTPSKSKRRGGDKTFGSGTGAINPKASGERARKSRTFDPFGNLWTAYQDSLQDDSDSDSDLDDSGSGGAFQVNRYNGGADPSLDDARPYFEQPESKAQYVDWKEFQTESRERGQRLQSRPGIEPPLIHRNHLRYLLQLDGETAVDRKGDFWPAPVWRNKGRNTVEL